MARFQSGQIIASLLDFRAMVEMRHAYIDLAMNLYQRFNAASTHHLFSHFLTSRSLSRTARLASAVTPAVLKYGAPRYGIRRLLIVLKLLPYNPPVLQIKKI